MRQKTLGITAPLRRVWWLSLLAGAYSCLAVACHRLQMQDLPDIPPSIDAGLAFAITLIIVFRVNRAYERWWEARTLWGKLVNVSRNLAVKTAELVDSGPEESTKMRDLIVAFSVGLKDHLRDEPDVSILPGFEEDPQPVHLPSHVTRRIYRLLEGWRGEGRLSDVQLLVFDSEVRELLEVAGACERIKNTLMSISWRRFVEHCLAAYLIILPWGLVKDFDLWTVPITALITYFVTAGEGIAVYVEEPFGTSEDHVDLEGICGGIDRSVSEVLG